MKTSVKGLSSLLLAWPLVLSAAVEWAPDTVVEKVLPGFVFAFSPDGTRLAYAAGRELWIAAPDTAQADRRLGFEHWDPEAAIAELVWSPDGDWLAVVAPRAEDQWDSIWLVDPDSGHIEDLLPPEVSDRFGSPGIRAIRIGTWLDARSIAFVQRCGTGCLAAHRVDFTTRSFGHYCVAGVDRGFAWDPAGAWAIFGGHLGALGFIDLGQASPEPWQECGVAFPGYDPQSSEGEWYAFEAAAPDGREVLLQRYSSEAERAGLVRWDLEGPPRELLSDARLAAFSPDGARIAFVGLGDPEPPDAPQSYAAELALLAPSGAVRALASLGRLAAQDAWGEEPLRPAWAPDGRRLVMQDGAGRVLLLAADGGAPPRELLRGARARVFWSPDGRRLIVQVADLGVPEIGTPYVLRLDDADP